MFQQAPVLSQPENNILSQRIMSTIGYHANLIAKIFKLNSNDKDDVRQRLALTALEAKGNYDPAQKTKFRTYIKAAIAFDAVDIMRQLERAPQIICYDEGCDLQETETFHQNRLRDIHKELTDPKAPKPKKRLQLNCGSYIQVIAVISENPNPYLKNDISIILNKLCLRERRICELLSKGVNRQEIANRLGIHKNTVRRAIVKIRQLFIEHGFGDY